MEFEYDHTKSVSNLEKHGISFEEAQKIWNDSFRIEIPARTSDEKRSLVIGSIDRIIWSAVTTLRENSIRIISVRKARKNEKQIYYSPGI
jgi:uncharacterized DUF497 family protein